jgi:hypothetical protein
MPTASLRHTLGVALSIVACGAVQAASLAIDHNASGTYTRTHAWSIGKTVSPATADMHPGDNQQFQFVVSVSKGPGTDSNHAVQGSATIHNGSGQNARITGISATLGGAGLSLDCGSFVPPANLAAGGSVSCTYNTGVAGAGATSASITVTTTGGVSGGVSVAPVAFGAPTTVVNDSITVNDSAGDSWTFGNSDSVTYQAMHGCTDNTSYRISNTATIAETGQSSTAEARMFCHVLRVNRSVGSGFARTWRWDVDKSHAETEPLMLTAGQTYNVAYTITATATAGDSALMASGAIDIINTNPVKAATLQSVQAAISGVGNADVDCPTLVIARNTTLTCTFSAHLPDLAPRTLTTTVTQINYDHALDATATPNGGTRQFIGHVPFVPVATPGTQVDRCTVLSDEYLGEAHDLGSACADGSPVVRMFTGPISVTEDSACEFEVPNLAHLVAADSGTRHSDGTLVRVVRTDCDPLDGCVLTPGYWKTHSAHGPAPYDPTWALVGEDTPFYLAVDAHGDPLSWYGVLWTPPKGNAYFILARAYIAASLNGLNGAAASDQVIDALAEAEVLFETWTAAEVAALRGNQAPRPRIIELAGILDMYNNGVGGLGPDACSEDATSAE